MNKDAQALHSALVYTHKIYDDMEFTADSFSFQTAQAVVNSLLQKQLDRFDEKIHKYADHHALSPIRIAMYLDRLCVKIPSHNNILQHTTNVTRIFEQCFDPPWRRLKANAGADFVSAEYVLYGAQSVFPPIATPSRLQPC